MILSKLSLHSESSLSRLAKELNGLLQLRNSHAGGWLVGGPVDECSWAGKRTPFPSFHAYMATWVDGSLSETGL